MLELICGACGPVDVMRLCAALTLVCHVPPTTWYVLLALVQGRSSRGCYCLAVGGIVWQSGHAGEAKVGLTGGVSKSGIALPRVAIPFHHPACCSQAPAPASEPRLMAVEVL